MSSLVVDIGKGPPRSIIGARLAEEFRKRNMPLLVQYAEETQHKPPRFGGAKHMPRRVLRPHETEEPKETRSSLSQYDFPQSEYLTDVGEEKQGGAYRRVSTVPRRVLGLHELEEPKEHEYRNLSYYELQDEHHTPRLEGDSVAGGGEAYEDHPEPEYLGGADEEHSDAEYFGGDDGYMLPIVLDSQPDVDVDPIPFSS